MTTQFFRVTVIGAGDFGTAIAAVAARNGHKVTLYARSRVAVDTINRDHINPSHLSGFILDPKIVATDNIENALQDADVLFLALPAQIIPQWLVQHKSDINSKCIICNTAKGLYVKDACVLSEAIERALSDKACPYTVLSGPSFAKEIMLRHPTSVVIASRFLYHAVFIQRLLSNNTDFRCYTSQDVIGVELGGALKNPLAIGAGMVEGVQLGINSMAAFVTRASLELQQLCQAMGGDAQTISGLSGIGDLMLTAFGDLSRNRTCGKRLATGETISQIILNSGSTIEGIPTAEVAVKFADACGLELPIFRTVAAIISGKLTVSEARSHLMGRPLIREMA